MIENQPLYRQTLGAQFDLLAPELQIFHAINGQVILHGRCQIDPPATFAARLLNRIVGLPQATPDAAFTFGLNANTHREIWQRNFPGRQMHSRMQVLDGMLVEHLGVFHFHFDLQVSQGELSMLLKKFTVLGLPCPRWLMPVICATENAIAGQLHFKVSASLPLVGLVSAYQGYLEIKPRASAE